MFDQLVVFILQAMSILAVLFIVIGLPLGETLINNKK